MPKIKTHSGAKKRFKLTKNGLVKMGHTNRRHILTKKSTKRKRCNMARVKGALATRKRRNRTLKLAKGYWGGKSRLFKTAKEAVWKSGQYAYIGRRLKKRDFRKLWITRISAAAKSNGMNYSTFMNGLKKAGITLNRKMLSEIAINDAAGFTALTEKAKAAL